MTPAEPREDWPEPRETIVTWRAVSGPVACYCGHLHYGWRPSDDQGLSPQWGYCADCDCKGLRRRGRTDA